MILYSLLKLVACSSVGNVARLDSHNRWTSLPLVGFSIHTRLIPESLPGNYMRVYIFAKEGTWQGFETNHSAWPLLQLRTDVRPEGFENLTPVRKLDTPLYIPTGQRYAFYITLEALNNLEYTNVRIAVIAKSLISLAIVTHKHISSLSQSRHAREVQQGLFITKPMI